MWKKEFDTSFAGLMKDGAEWLVENTDIKLIGKTEIVLSINLEQLENKIIVAFFCPFELRLSVCLTYNTFTSYSYIILTIVNRQSIMMQFDFSFLYFKPSLEVTISRSNEQRFGSEW